MSGIRNDGTTCRFQAKTNYFKYVETLLLQKYMCNICVQIMVRMQQRKSRENFALTAPSWIVHVSPHVLFMVAKSLM